MIIGNGNASATFLANQKVMTWLDTGAPCLALQWSPKAIAGEVPTLQKYKATYAVSVGGDVVLKVYQRDNDGDAGATLTYTITAASAKVAWSSYAASAATFQDVADLITELDGFTAWVLDAPTFAPVDDANGFIVETETAIASGKVTGAYTKCMNRDVSGYQVDSDYVSWMRVGLPEPRDADSLKLIKINGTLTGNTNGEIRVFRDDPRDYTTPTLTYDTDLATKNVVFEKAALTTTETTYLEASDPDRAMVVQGPLIVEVRSDNLTVLHMNVLIAQATIGY